MTAVSHEEDARRPASGAARPFRPLLRLAEPDSALLDGLAALTAGGHVGGAEHHPVLVLLSRATLLEGLPDVAALVDPGDDAALGPALRDVQRHVVT